MAKIVWNYIKFVSVGAFAGAKASWVFVYFISAYLPERQQCDTYSEPTNFQEKENLFHFCTTNDNNSATPHSSTLIVEPHTHFSAIHLFGRGIFCVVNLQINANVIKLNWKRKRKQLECSTRLVKLFVWIFHLFCVWCGVRRLPSTQNNNS